MARNQIQIQKGMFEPEFERFFGAEEACCQALEKLRWPEGFPAPPVAMIRFIGLRFAI